MSENCRAAKAILIEIRQFQKSIALFCSLRRVFSRLEELPGQLYSSN